MPEIFNNQIRWFIFAVFLVAVGKTNANNQYFEELSNVESALLIDSLENVLSSTKATNGEVLYQLAFLYYNLDIDKSKELAQRYILQVQDVPIDRRGDVYLLLSSLYTEINKPDSALLYIKEYDNISKELYDSKIAELISQYTSSDKEFNTSILGMPVLYFVIILFLLLALIILYFFTKMQKRNMTKLELAKNAELEASNIKLQQFNNELQEAIMERSYDKALEFEECNNEIVNFKKTLKKDEDAIYLKNAFLGSMSHQIRTPLSGIMGFSDMLETEFALKGDEDMYEYARNIQESGEKLMSLITNIIDISSIEANILELKPDNLDTNNLLHSLIKDYELKAKSKGLIFKTKINSPKTICYADEQNLLKVIKIILNNAIQYTSKGFVTIATGLNDDRSVNIEINDTGSGIDEKTLNLLTDSFDYSKSGSSLIYEGNGLGLILAHRLVTLMNGKMIIKTSSGKGTTVKIILPSDKDSDIYLDNKDLTSKNTKKIDDVSIISAPGLGRITILVVEDDRMNRIVIEKMLKKAGNIIIAQDGDDTLMKFEDLSKKKNKVDVVLMDINLPEPWDGIKLMQKIRSDHSWTKNIPFIAQTAYAMIRDKDMYLEAGFDDYISKPINKNELLTMIQKQLELKIKDH